MTVIRPNSISGITSITGFGGDISIFRADGTAADVTVNNITSGVITATTFSGNVTGAVTGSGANLTSIPAGQLTGTIADARLSTVSSSKLSGALPALDGSALTGVGVGTADSINTSGIITATAFAPTEGQLSHRNLIINGDYRIAQRATSSTSTGFQTVDRWSFHYGGHNEAPTQAQVDLSSSDTPYSFGFRKAFKITNGNQTSTDGNDYIAILTPIEAQDLANSGWNYTSASSYITLSFWAKSSVARTFTVQLYTADGTPQAYNHKYPLLANTWTKVTHSFPGFANVQFDNDANKGMEIQWNMYSGTTYTQGSTVDQWLAYNGNTSTPDESDAWWTTNDATFEITGVQLEVGSVATPFEHRSHAEELTRCQRYYYKQSSEHQYMRYDCHGQCPSANGAQFVFSLPVKMRAIPTIGYSQLSDFYIYASNLQAKTPTNITLSAGSTKSPMLSFEKSSTFSAGAGAHLTVPNSNQGYIAFNAEL